MAYTVQENKILSDRSWGGRGGPATDLAMSASFNSEALDALYFDKGCIQVFWSNVDATDGTLVLQASLQTDWGWADVPGSARTILCADGSVLWDISSYSFRYFRVSYTANSITTGDMNIFSLLKTTRG